MKILMMTNMFPNPTSQVNGIFLLKAAQKLRSLEHDFSVIYPVQRPPFPLNLIPPWKYHSAGFPRESLTDGFSVEFPRYCSSHKLVAHRNSGKALCFWLNRYFKRQTKDFQPELIWAQPALPVGYAVMKLSEKTGVPYIITVHGADMNISVHQPGASSVLREIYENARAVVAISGRLQREVLAIAPKANTRLIYNGLDLQQLQTISRTSFDSRTNVASENIVKIVSVSNLIETKGIRYNIETLGRLRKDNANLHYDIVGDGVERGNLERLVSELGLSDKVTFHGELPYSQAMTVIAEADFLSLPSYQEGFGVVYAEAMAMSVPVIGVAAQGIADIVQHGVNGFLATPQDVNSLEEIWRKLINDAGLRQQVGEAGRETVVTKLSWEKTAQDYDDLFQLLIKR